ncbi:hypothetical protein VPHK469_0191 [Vibrio phage K469]
MPKSFREFHESEMAGSTTPSVAGNVSHARDKKKKEKENPVNEGTETSEPEVE